MKKYFYNISNHPSSKWDEKQLEAANEFGEIIDIRMPHIPADRDIYYVLNVASAVVKEVVKYAQKNEVVAMVTAESTLEYAIITGLHQCNIKCVAPVYGNAHEGVDKQGKTIRILDFYCFRPYMELDTELYFSPNGKAMGGF